MLTFGALLLFCGLDRTDGFYKCILGTNVKDFIIFKTKVVIGIGILFTTVNNARCPGRTLKIQTIDDL